MLRQPLHLPKTPGIYIFRRGKTPIYIGKAADLKKRLTSYWKRNADGKVNRLIEEATKVGWIKLESEIEALIKEAELIKKYQPKYNYLLRDDKNYFYVAITEEKYPRIFITHQPVATATNQKSKTPASPADKKNQKFQYIGPFTSGSTLKAVLKMLRRAFPYCTCKKLHRRRCLNAEIERCPGFCCQTSGRDVGREEEYRKNIRHIAAILGGSGRKILSQLKLDMKTASQKQKFERAAEIRDHINNIENIFRHKVFLEKPGRPEHNWSKVERTLKQLLGTNRNLSRVEGYDISNISGTSATGSMAVFIGGRPAKSEYRKFRIKTVRDAHDVAMLKEVIRRRLAHTEWPYPDLTLIDGGKPQLNAALAALSCSQLPVTGNRPAVAGLAKREEELYVPGRKPVLLSSLPPHTAHFLQHVRDESHRFAKKYHHKLREKLYQERH